MSESNVYLGLDVHSSVMVAVAVDEDGTERNLGVFANDRKSIRKVLKKAGKRENIRAVYEAGPTGYALYWELTQLGVKCQVASPSLIPTRAGC